MALTAPTFVGAGPAEILRAVQKDRILVDVLEKQLNNLAIRLCGECWFTPVQDTQRPDICSSGTSLVAFETKLL